MCLTSTYLGQITKFSTIMQDLKRVMDLNCKWKKDYAIQSFNWFSNVKNLDLSNGSEHVQNVIQRY